MKNRSKTFMDTNNLNKADAHPSAVSMLPSVGFVRLQQVLAVYPVSRSSWWAGIQKGLYPRGVQLAPRTTAWRVEEIRELINKVREKKTDA